MSEPSRIYTGDPVWREIESWIEDNTGTGSATALERLTLSLWSPHYRYSMSAIFHPLDDIRAGLVVDAVTAYSANGERDQDFMRLAQSISDRYEALGHSDD